MKRDPAQDPRAGDVLTFKQWAIHVTQVDSGNVFYSATHPTEEPRRERSQSLTEWRSWAKDAEVVKVDGRPRECQVFSFGVSGPCTICRKPLGESVHVSVVGVCHAECCCAVRHVSKKAKKEAA